MWIVVGREFCVMNRISKIQDLQSPRSAVFDVVDNRKTNDIYYYDLVIYILYTIPYHQKDGQSCDFY